MHILFGADKSGHTRAQAAIALPLPLKRRGLRRAEARTLVSGQSFWALFVHIATFHDDKWVRFQNYTDTGTIVATLR